VPSTLSFSQFFCSSLTNCQAQRKVLTFSQVILTNRAFSQCFHKDCLLSLSQCSLIYPAKSASLARHQAFSSPKNSVIHKCSPVLFSTWLLHQDSSSFSLFGASMQLHSSSSFALPSFLYTFTHKTSHAQPCSRHGENIHRQKSGRLIIPKHTLKARVFTLCGNPLSCYNGLDWKPVVK